MRIRLALALGLGIAVSGCDPAVATPPPAGPASQTRPLAATFEVDACKVDKVGPNDGALTPDGVEDLAFNSTIDGPIAALFIVSVDENGMPTGQFQADTLVGDQVRPPELGNMRGGATSGLGVFDGNTALNAADGSLPVLASAHRQLTLYVAKALALHSGMRLRVFVLRPDKTLEAGATVIH